MDNILAEYNNLWSKLNLIAEPHNNLFIFTLTASGTILTFAIQQNNQNIVLVNMIILIVLRCRVMSYRDDYYMTLAFGTLLTYSFLEGNNGFIAALFVIFVVIVVALDIYYFFYSGKLYEKYKENFEQTN